MTFCNFAVLDNTVSCVSLIRDLGVYLNTKFSFNHQVTNIVNSSLSVFGVITHISSNFKNAPVFLRLFRSLVRSRLEFSLV